MIVIVVVVSEEDDKLVLVLGRRVGNGNVLVGPLVLADFHSTCRRYARASYWMFCLFLVWEVDHSLESCTIPFAFSLVCVEPRRLNSQTQANTKPFLYLNALQKHAR